VYRCGHIQLVLKTAQR